MKTPLRTPRVHPAAPKVLQGGPEMPKWFPRVLPRCQNNHQGTKLEAPSPPNGNRQELKGSHCSNWKQWAVLAESNDTYQLRATICASIHIFYPKVPNKLSKWNP